MKRKPSSTAQSRKTYVTKKGYRRFKDSGIYVHRWVEEKKLGRKLKVGEIVHHINGNTLDNSSNNLKIYKNQSQHMKKEH
jgi:PDZ domain-containing secreted protein